jgi:hypothetical protein
VKPQVNTCLSVLKVKCLGQNQNGISSVSYIHTNHSRFIPEGVAEASQILLRDAHVLPKLLGCVEYCRRDR